MLSGPKEKQCKMNPQNSTQWKLPEANNNFSQTSEEISKPSEFVILSCSKMSRIFNPISFEIPTGSLRQGCIIEQLCAYIRTDNCFLALEFLIFYNESWIFDYSAMNSNFSCKIFFKSFTWIYKYFVQILRPNSSML